MKRDGYIIEEIIERANLESSFDTVVHGTKRKELKEGKWLLAHRESFLDDVAKEIASGHVNVSNYHEKHIHEGNKWRDIQVFNMRTRIKINAVMSVVDKHLHRRYIRTTAASIKQRGMHDLKTYIEKDIQLYPKEMKYIYKFDIKKFYPTIQQDFVMYCIRRVFKDKRLISILEGFVRLLPNGLSMGLRSSQGLATLLLSLYLDHYLKDRYGIKHFYRYCDDGVIAAGSKRYLWECRKIVHERMEAIGQTVKFNDSIFPITKGLDFLGYVIYPTHVRLRKRVKQHLARKLHKVKSRKRRQQIVGSLYGLCKHCNSKNLLNTLLTTREMRKFSEMGVTYTPEDGKKRFQGKTVRLAEIVNSPIEVHDYEKDVVTKHGDHRYLISFRDKATREFSKFFTNSEELKSILDQVAKMKDGFPFETIIRSEAFDGNKFKYKFT